MDSNVLKEKLCLLGREANKKFPELNYGGCCVFAAEVGKALRRLGVDTEVIVPNRGIYIQEARNNVRNIKNVEEWEDQGVYFGHVALRFKLNGEAYTYDSDSLHKGGQSFGGLLGENYDASPDGMTIEEAEALASVARNWNSTFPRRQIPAVRRLVNQYLS